MCIDLKPFGYLEGLWESCEVMIMKHLLILEEPYQCDTQSKIFFLQLCVTMKVITVCVGGLVEGRGQRQCLLYNLLLTIKKDFHYFFLIAMYWIIFTPASPFTVC